MFVNVILIIAIVVIIFFAVRGTVKHFKGESGCCGGGGGTVIAVEPKVLDKVVATKEISIDGMKCENCSARVQNSLNSLENVSATVNLKKKIAVVKIGEGVTDEQLKNAVEKDGYKVVDMKELN